MLGNQRKNQATDSQFMDTAWKNMAEILDQEMPVEKEERRIGWLSIAAILVMGFVGGISVMWGLQKHQTAPMADNHTIPTINEMDIATTEFQKEETPNLTHNIPANNSKTTRKQITSPRLDKITSDAKSKKINNQNLLATSPSKKQESKRDIMESTSYISPKEITTDLNNQQTLIVSNPIDLLPEEATIAAITPVIEFEKELIKNATPLTELPTLGLTTLPMEAGFSIDHDLDLPKNKKWRTGIYAGAIVAGTTGNGLEAGWRVERKLGAKWALETGLGFRATQIAFLSKNENQDNLSLEDVDYQDGFNTSNPDSLGPSLVDQERVANAINVNEPNYQLAVPFSLIYRPTGKLRLALGMSWAYRLNKLKDVSSVLPNNEFFLAEDTAKNSFSDRLDDMRLNLGVGYYLNPRTGVELAYSQQLSKNNNASNASAVAVDDNISARFFQLSLVHYFGK